MLEEQIKNSNEENFFGLILGLALLSEDNESISSLCGWSSSPSHHFCIRVISFTVYPVPLVWALTLPWCYSLS